MTEILNRIRWDDNGLIPAIAQDATTGKILMFAWMNREALEKTLQLKQAVYFSRTRKKLWFKGEESGHVQQVKDLRIDCDQDVVLLQVDQIGGIACHTGRNSCFFEQYDFSEQKWQIVEPVLKDPEYIYSKQEEV